MMKSATQSEFNAAISQDTFTESATNMLGGSREDFYAVGAKTLDQGPSDNRLACRVDLNGSTTYFVNDPNRFIAI